MSRRLGWGTFALLVTLFAWHSATHSVDFPLYWGVGAQILDGNFELYAPPDSTGASYLYAPAIAFLFVPLALLPLEVAAFIFFCLKVLALIYIGRTLARYLDAPAHVSALLLVSLLVTGGYLVEEFRNGNFHLFVVALMVLAFDAAERGKVAIAAAALALAIAAKVSPVILLAYFALRRRWVVAAATLAGLVILLVLPAVVTGYDVNSHMAAEFIRAASEKIDEPANYALRGVLLRYVAGSGAAFALTLVWLGLVLSGGAWLVARFWRTPSDPTTRVLELSVVMTVMLLASPHTQRQHFSALCVPVIVLLGLLARAPEIRGRVLIRFALGMTAAAGTLLPLVLGSRRLAVMYEAASPYFFATLFLLVTLVALTGRLGERRLVDLTGIEPVTS